MNADNVRALVMVLGAVTTALSMVVGAWLVLLMAVVMPAVIIGMYARWHA